MLRRIFCFSKKVACFLIVFLLFCTTAYADSNPTMTISWPDDELYVTGSEQTYNPSLTINADYIQLEYIENTSTSNNVSQYFDTGYQHGPTSNYEFTIQFNTCVNPDSIFGATSGNTSELYLYRTNSPDGHLVINATNSTGCHTDFVDTSNKHLIKVKDRKINIDGADKTFTSGTWNSDVANCTCSDYLFAFNNNGSASNQGHFKLYSFKIYSGNTLERNFIPVLTLKVIDASKVNENESIPVGTPCLYDLKNNKFYKKKGTDEFAAGPALVTLNGTQYGVLDYIKSDGTNYIDADFKYTGNDIKISIGFNQDSVAAGASKTVLGHFEGRDANYKTGITIHYQDGGKIFYSAASATDISRNYYSTGTYNEFDIERINKNITGFKDGTSPTKDPLATNSGDTQRTLNPYIFTQNRSSGEITGSNSTTSLYYLEMYDTLDPDGKYNIKRNFIPVKRMSDNAIGLYDLAGNKFYTQTVGNNFITSDHAPTGQNAIYHIVDNGFHDYSNKKTDKGDYVAGVKLGNIGKAILASSYKDLTHDWSIVSNNFNPTFNSYNGDYDGNDHALSLVNVKDNYDTVIDSSKYTIKYSLDDGTTYDKDISDVNAFYNNFKDIGTYIIKFKITPTSSYTGLYEELVSSVNVVVKKKGTGGGGNSSLHIVPNTGVYIN